MAELVVDFITSLDGYAAAEGWPGWWGLEGPEYFAWLEQSAEKDYTVLMGATTYRLMLGFASQGEPGTDVLGGFPKIVFSRTLTEPLAWENSSLVADDAVESVRDLKEQGRSMRTLGSLALCRSLLSAGLVDRFRVVIFPVITGATGRERIYDGYPDVALDMVDSRTFDGRIQLVEYTPRVLTGPPGGAPSHEGNAHDTELKDSTPNASGPERAAGQMGVSSERVGDVEQEPEENPVGLEPKADYPSADPRSD